MPTENDTDFNVIYAIDEQSNKFNIGKIETYDSIDFETDIDSKEPIFCPYGDISFEVQMSPPVFYLFFSLFASKRLVPNNWLKRHHIPMNRRNKK